MKALTMLLLAGALRAGAQSRPKYAQAPFFKDYRVVQRHLQQLRRQGVTAFAVYQMSVPTFGPEQKAAGGTDFGRTITYCFWKVGTREYAQKYTDSTTYEPVALTSQVFGFPAYATTAVTQQEQAQLNLSPPVTDARPAPRPREVVLFSTGGPLRYFETKNQLTYDPDPARQRLRERWAARLQAAARQAEARFGPPQPYHRPPLWEPQ
jgi:hypothetical protein